jgi:hypothetical protein
MQIPLPQEPPPVPAPAVKVCPAMSICCCGYCSTCVNRGLEVRGAVNPGWAQEDRGAWSGHKGLSLGSTAMSHWTWTRQPLGAGNNQIPFPYSWPGRGGHEGSPTPPGLSQHSGCFHCPVFWTVDAIALTGPFLILRVAVVSSGSDWMSR